MDSSTNEIQKCPRRMETPLFDREGNDEWDVDRRWKGKFPWSWTPRTCTFCGGIHPDDAIKLRKQGWIIEYTTKNYKLYMQLPENSVGRIIGVVPPVKVYLQHFSKEQRSALMT